MHERGLEHPSNDRRRATRLTRITALWVGAIVTITVSGWIPPDSPSKVETVASALTIQPTPVLANAGRGPTALPRTTEDPAVPVDGGENAPAVRAAALAVTVPDPRGGDLRIDSDADVLPLSYSPPAAATTILDVAYGSDPAQQLDLYLPLNRNAPVVMFLHSGGWISGDKRNVPDMAMRFVERGYAVVSVEYRLAPQHTFPAQVHDVKHAIRWLKSYGEHAGLVDGNRIVAYGTSAGGHLAAFIGATPGRYEPTELSHDETRFDSTIVGVISVVGPTDLVQLYAQPHPWAAGLAGLFMGCDLACRDEQLAEASIDGYLHADLPPAYWAYGRLDPLVEPHTQGRVIADAWAADAGVDSSWLDIVDDHGHNVDESSINQRFVEEFVDLATLPRVAGA